MFPKRIRLGLRNKKRNASARAAKKAYLHKETIKIAKEIVNKIIEDVFVWSEEKANTSVEQNMAPDKPTCSKYLSPVNQADSSSPKEGQFELHEEYGFFTEPEYQKECEKIEAHIIDREVVQDNNVLNGCRIVEIDYFLKTTISAQQRHSKHCTGGNLLFQKEIRVGVKSDFILTCNMCHKEIKISNENPRNEPSVLNKAVVWATIATGSTHTHTTEFLSIMDIPGQSNSLFYKIQRQLSEVWQDSLIIAIEEAAMEEKKMAIERGDIDANGIPFITVLIDGGWSKRSYGHTYNACSGVAVVIGKITGKVLFVGVRNKYCSICAKYINKGKEIVGHVCFKNWNGSSSAMEPDIIVEAFNSSIETHGLKYSKFIADGDSTVFARIRERVSYGLEVQKSECTNHVLKNFGKSLNKIKSDTKGVPLPARKLLTKEIMDELTSGVQCAIYANVNDADSLKTDIRNTFYHVFGNHVACKPYLCTNIGDVTKDRSQVAAESGLHHHVLASIQQLTTKAHLLLDKETNNRAELFMSLLARFNMGKRLNLIQRDSFQMRSHITGLKYNYGYRWHEKPWKTVFKKSPGKQLKQFMTIKEKANLKRKTNNKNVGSKKKLKFTDEKIKEYGPNIAEVNLSDDELKNEIENLRLRLQVNIEQQQKIAVETVGQFSNLKYLTEKMFRLTASNFGAVVKRKEHTPCDCLVKKLLSRKPFSTPSTTYGKNNEAVAINIFSEKTGKNVQPAGLHIDLIDGFLAASPDGIINDDEIVEVKCSLKVANSGKTLSSAVRDKDLVYLAINDENDIKIKENHDYYYQIQGQLAITGAKLCHFIVYTGAKNEIFIQEISKDEVIWKTLMLPKLKRFYLECVAPEIILNRRSRELKCLDPPFILEAQKIKHKK